MRNSTVPHRIKKRKVAVAISRGANLPRLAKRWGVPLKKLRRWKQRFQGQTAGGSTRILRRQARVQLQKPQSMLAKRDQRAGMVNRNSARTIRMRDRLQRLQSRIVKIKTTLVETQVAA